MRTQGLTFAAAVSTLIVVGCGGSENSSSTTVQDKGVTATVAGTVIEAKPGVAQRTPIDGASVKLVVAGKVRTKKTGSEGRFRFEGVPLASNAGHNLEISKDGFVKTETTINPGSVGGNFVDYDNINKFTHNLGYIGLSKSQEIAVAVTRNGSKIGQQAPVLAIPQGPNNVCSGVVQGSTNATLDFSRVVATTSSGTAKLALAECGTYNIFVPAHGSSKNLPAKFTTASFQGNPYNPANSDSTLSVAISRASRDDGIRIVDNSLLDKLSVSYRERNFSDTGGQNPFDFSFGTFGPGQNVNPGQAVNPGDDIKVVFNYPVQLANGVDLSLTRFTEDPDQTGDGSGNSDGSVDSDFNDRETLATSDVSLDATGTVLTISPQASLPVNEVVQIEGKLIADRSGQQDLTRVLNQTVYVANGTQVSDELGAITADNYVPSDGTPDTDDGNRADTYLEFPKYLIGQIAVQSYTTQGGSTTVLDDQSRNFSVSEILWTDAKCDNCGSGKGTVARVNLTDLVTGAPQFQDGATIKLEMHLEGFEGSATTTKTLTVN